MENNAIISVAEELSGRLAAAAIVELTLHVIINAGPNLKNAIIWGF